MSNQLSYLSSDKKDDNHLKLSPILKWAGGKRWLIPMLEPVWNYYAGRRLIEPFCGGLAVSLGLLPEKARLNDINPHLINFYRWVQRGLSVTISMENDENIYYSHRTRFNKLVLSGESNTSEAAQLFYFLNRTCYNGLCRFNSKGEFNVPFGKYKTINYADDFLEYSSLFSSWEFSNAPFEEVDLKNGDFVYADPPYDVEFTSYSKEKFLWEDHIRLAERLSQHKGPVVISNQATRRVISLYKQNGFEIVYYNGRRRISSNGDRNHAKEVLALRLPSR